MKESSVSHIHPLLPGVLLALLAILFGFGLGGAFGAFESDVKAELKSSADAVLETVYENNAEKRDAILSKSWSYMKRSHMHGAAIGTAALASILLLAMLGAPGKLEKYSAIAFGAGALIYGVFWMLAAFKAPAIGSTHEAKESLKFIAVPGAGLSILGLLGTIISTIKAFCRRPV